MRKPKGIFTLWLWLQRPFTATHYVNEAEISQEIVVIVLHTVHTHSLERRFPALYQRDHPRRKEWYAAPSVKLFSCLDKNWKSVSSSAAICLCSAHYYDRHRPAFTIPPFCITQVNCICLSLEEMNSDVDKMNLTWSLNDIWGVQLGIRSNQHS